MSTEGDEHDDDAEQPGDDLILGTAVESLMEDGDEQAAALLLDVISWRTVLVDVLIMEEELALCDLVLTTPRFVAQRFTDEVLGRIEGAFSEAGRPAGYLFRNIRIETPLTEPGWRERAEARLGQGPSNQGTAAPPPKKWITEDRMRFRDVGERNVYRAFKRAQQRLPSTESITILPNASARPFVGHTWEPDFVIAYKGRVGIVEIDGPSHQGRAAADKSRNHFFENSGVAYVDRWAVEDSTDDATLDEHVERFLKRLVP